MDVLFEGGGVVRLAVTSDRLLLPRASPSTPLLVGAVGQPIALLHSFLERVHEGQHFLEGVIEQAVFGGEGGPLLEALLSSEDPTMDVPADDELAPGPRDKLTGEGAAADRPQPDPS